MRLARRERLEQWEVRARHVDELRLKIFPVVLGDGERLFGETSDNKRMRLVEIKTIDDDVAYLTYERVRDG